MFRNCPEWIIAELGLFMWSMVSVPLYTKLGPATISYILAEVESAVVIAMDEASVRAILDCLPMASPRFQVI